MEEKAQQPICLYPYVLVVPLEPEAINLKLSNIYTAKECQSCDEQHRHHHMAAASGHQLMDQLFEVVGLADNKAALPIGGGLCRDDVAETHLLDAGEVSGGEKGAELVGLVVASGMNVLESRLGDS
jgi:hypothetical protein